MIITMIDWLLGCSHSKTSRVFTLRVRRKLTCQQYKLTYIVCLDCGKEFEYDLENMRIRRNNSEKYQAQPAEERG